MSVKTVVITGAGSGLGRELAINYAQRGARVAVADFLVERAQETIALLSGSGHVAIKFGFELPYQAWLSA